MSSRRGSGRQAGSLNDKLANFDGQILFLKDELACDEAQLKRDRTELAGIVLENPEYRWVDGGLIQQAAIQFRIANKTDMVVARLYFTGTLATPGRSVPWAKGGILYDFKGGLEPGETQDVLLAPPMSSDWNDKSLQDLKGATLTIVVDNVVDANGHKMVDIEEKDLARLRDRIAAMEAERRKLEARLPG